ncbi:conserved hypothetical protein [Gammaproteobacteria bacterium]
MHKNQENPEFESKSIQFKVDEFGKVSASIATFGVVDHDDDIVEATAFKDGQEVAMVWSHNWDKPVGKGVIRVMPTEAVFEGSFFMDTIDGQEAYKTVKAMDNLQEWSWGFRTMKSTWEQRGDAMIRHLIETEVYEVSPVLKGAGMGTRTLAIKGRLSLKEQIEYVQEIVDSLGERVRSLKGLREADGREISEEKREEIRLLAKSLRDAAEELEAGTVKLVDASQEYAKFLLLEARRNGVGKG